MAKRQALEEDAKARALAFNVKQVEKVKKARNSWPKEAWRISFRDFDRRVWAALSLQAPLRHFRAAFPPNYL